MMQWFDETEETLRFGYAVKEVLFQGQSQFQSIDVIETLAYGRMLVIDKVVMLTEADEFVYHEMMAHVPICHHPSPKQVLIIGGGDGGTVRELVKHPEVESIVLCEIDELVVDTCRKYFPAISSCLDDPRVEIKIGDGIAYLQGLKQAFDLIIVDSTDPVGPGAVLFTPEFYHSVAAALKPGGMMVAQTESPWDQAQMIKPIYDKIRGQFDYVYPYAGPVAAYPRGLWSWTLASDKKVSADQIIWERFDRIKDGLSFLTPAKLRTIFDMSPFHRRKLEDVLN